MEIKTQTQVQQWTARQRAVKTEIMHLLNWNDLEYGEYQYQQGCIYLRFAIGYDTTAIKYLEADKVFWNWFKNKWLQNEEGFISQQLYDLSLTVRRQLYEGLQAGQILAGDITLERFITEPIYKKFKMHSI